MTFTPAIALGGYAGFLAFDRSLERQQAAFADSAEVRRDVEYFREGIASATNADDLVGDRRLLKVALGAFGLTDEIDKKAFIRKVLEEGTDDPQAFANRLNDNRWRDFAAAFGYGDIGGPFNGLSGFAARIAERYEIRAFEEAVGGVDETFRLALNFRREIAAVAEGANADRVGWFQIMGRAPLRAVMEGAFGLPSSLAVADIERQKTLFEDKLEAATGSRSPSVLADPEVVEGILRRYFATAESAGGGIAASTRGAAAVSLLSGGGSASALVLASALRTG